jgi:hypothetical protein
MRDRPKSVTAFFRCGEGFETRLDGRLPSGLRSSICLAPTQADESAQTKGSLSLVPSSMRDTSETRSEGIRTVKATGSFSP